MDFCNFANALKLKKNVGKDNYKLFFVIFQLMDFDTILFMHGYTCI